MTNSQRVDDYVDHYMTESFMEIPA